MAERVYYGTCKTGAATKTKVVYISDEDINDGFQFEEGDLLTVFFADTNTVDEPEIVITNEDSEQDISVSDDSGKSIKSLDVEAGMKDAWAAGETVIFAYTQQSTSNAYYWELIDANHASVETYGNTKLFDDTKLNDLLDGSYDGETDIALTPVTLKNFYELLTAEGEESEEEEPVIPIGLKWIPNPEALGDLDDLGTLSLTNGTDGIVIKYPLTQKIQDCINSQIHETITHTGQLTNNGNGIKPDDPTNPNTEPFITRVVPDDLYFGNGRGLYYGTPNTDPEQESTAKPRIILNDDQNYLVIGSTNDDSLNGVYINKPLLVSSNAQVTGDLTVGNPTAVEGVSIIAEKDIISEAYVKGISLYEDLKGNSTAIRQIYSPQIQVFSINCPTKTIDEGKSSGHIEINITRQGWTPIGVAGYNVNFKGEKSGDAAYANVWECCVKNNTTLRYAIRNLRNDPITINIVVDILYIKQLS